MGRPPGYLKLERAAFLAFEKVKMTISKKSSNFLKILKSLKFRGFVRFLTFFILLSFCFKISFADTNPKLTLDLVVSKALKTSGAFKALEAQKKLAESTLMQSQIPYVWNLEMGLDKLDNRNATSSPFSPKTIQSSGVSVGFSKYFSTGTTLTTKLRQTENSLGFAPASGVVIPDYKETIATLALSQNLWKDAFGSGIRNQEASLVVLNKAQELGYLESQKNYALGVIAQYYSAWLAQQKLKSNIESHKRKETLLRSVKLRSNIGTAESTEVLQTEAAVLLSETSLAQSQEDLNEKWRELIVLINLPDQLFSYPALQVNIEMSKSESSGDKVCADSLAAKIEIAESVEINRLKLKSALLNKDAAMAQQKSSLLLTAQLNSNGINADRSSSEIDAINGKNPSWALGLTWKKPLGDTLDEAQYKQAEAKLIQAEDEFRSSLDKQKIELIKACSEWKDVRLNLPRVELAQKKQSERAKLEQSRFSVGKSTAFQVIQAGDDATFAQYSYNQILVQNEILSWKLAYLTGQMKSEMDKWMNE